ncbi:putative n-acetylglucosaminyl transferase component gpi1 protein [Neofusicoccum parvum UCRNP2]|uniref:N-acetylglucosaminyl transferase component gpi1 n=2 Tax=Neofusicoccum parvum TaxID=310453 RepID=A0ACB5RPD6_9PEZI|nr:putative n-acetylglucosaminyl transferase component gpi1 protein [Neofusicoccum parvum UCRNP2]GME22066.1 n-acetylglucosaminyl transferase component gpi1 [Neofusicoccum parvum]
MHPFSVLTAGIFVAGYITARWDLVTRLYELAIFAWDHGVVTRAAKGFVVLSIAFFVIIVPIERIASHEADEVSPPALCLLLQADITTSTPEPEEGASPHANN